MKTAPAAALAALLCAACSSAPAPATEHLTVFAAASLKSTFTDLGARFEKDNPGTTVAFNFAGSSDLVTQLTQGAPADVFASADQATMAKAVDGGLVSGNPVTFATNTLTIVTPPGNPDRIATFADLARPGVQVVVCAPQVPCGAATEKLEKAANVALSPVSEESSVTDVLGKITSGQADAGLVYVTDAASAGEKVAAIAFPESRQAVNRYPIAILEQTRSRSAAQRFVDLVTGPQGRGVLTAAGFAEP
ncbi:molybdate ABC transporter substrate-binding protein [Mycobacterium rufum]|uniref:Molybdate ABC transporter substrate-binding protein n=1 Tax=Mycolicibacterium rufum TaxID=318424 RepID=A0A9X3BIF2_9MYCO|nr:molybdate ABC transporter substrate-binding protein [Mycolicibacterium rufum]